MSSAKTKLSDFLAQVLITPSMRPGRLGICEIILCTGLDLRRHHRWLEQFRAAREACSQTGLRAYPVRHSRLKSRQAFEQARLEGSLWRGEYGRNRRKLLRDCIRWLRSQGL